MVLPIEFLPSRSGADSGGGEDAPFHERFQEMIDLCCAIDRHGVIRSVYRPSGSHLGMDVSPMQERRFLNLVHPDDVETMAKRLSEMAASPDATICGVTRLRLGEDGWTEIYFVARNACDVIGMEETVLYAWTDAAPDKFQAGKGGHVDKATRREIADIVHAFNNSIGAILAFGKLLTEDLSEGSPQLEYAQRIVSASERSREIIRRLSAL